MDAPDRQWTNGRVRYLEFDTKGWVVASCKNPKTSEQAEHVKVT